MNRDPVEAECESGGNDEVAPGFVEERRVFLKAPLAAAAGLILARVAGAPSQETSMPRASSAGQADLDFTAFFDECAALARQAAQSRALDEDAHLSRISSVAARLRLETVPEAKTRRFAGLNPPVEFGPIKAEPPLVLILWRLAPG